MLYEVITVVLPQAVLRMLPLWGNLLIELLKGTALVSLITVPDLAFRAFRCACNIRFWKTNVARSKKGTKESDIAARSGCIATIKQMIETIIELPQTKSTIPQAMVSPSFWASEVIV